MAYVDFVGKDHNKTKRDYIGRVNAFPKAEAIKIAKRYDKEYWDGDRKFGYGGFRYDGRWVKVAEDMAKYYNIKPGDRILDIGCGKGFLLYDFTQVVPGVEVCGVDISRYAIENAKEEVRPFLKVANAADLPFEDNRFDLVLSINTVHNLYCYDMVRALKGMERVSRKHKYLVTESYRNEAEKVNLMYWVLTGECFFSEKEWEWFFQLAGYTGDHSFIYFES